MNNQADDPKRAWGGFTRRWRKRWKKGYHQDAILWVLMDYFIDFANYKDSEIPFFWKGKLVKMIPLKRGQIFFTIPQIFKFFESDLNDITFNKVKNRVFTLSNIGFLHIQSQHHYSIATILNYNRYNPLPQDRPQPIPPPIIESSNSNVVSNVVSNTVVPICNKLINNNKYKIAKNMPDFQKIIKETIEYLNQQADVSFNPTTYATQTLMVERIQEGATLADFKSVITKKVSQWINDDRMRGNLAPSTLFASDKFEKYLQEASRKPTKSKPTKLSGIQLLGLGHDILNKFGKEKFKEFCKLNQLSADDIHAIENRFE